MSGRVYAFSFAVVLAAAIPATGQSSNPAVASEEARSDAFDVPAIIALSDADMIASAYIDGKLGPMIGTDVMTVLRFSGQVEPSSMATLPIGNSVAGPPAALATTPDGRFALSVETRGPRPASGEDVGLTNLPRARGIFVVDMANLAHPRLVQRVEGPRLAETISVSADGARVAIAVDPAGDGVDTPLWIFRFADGQLSGGSPTLIPDWVRGDHLVSAVFAPTGSRIALLNATRRTVSLFDLDGTGAVPRLTSWGNPVDVEKYPFAIKFSPDGRFLFANANYADDHVLPVAPFGFPKGTLTAIRLDAQRGDHGAPVHLISSQALVGRGPEALAVSPDGQFVVSVNLEGSFWPAGDPRRTRYSSLSLFRFDGATGVLDKVGDFPFDGVLPESAVFDRSSRRLAVANFQQLDNPSAPGSIDFWRIVDDPLDPRSTTMVRTNRSISTPRGTMMLAVPGQR